MKRKTKSDPLAEIEVSMGSDLERYHAHLAIDRDDLDEGLAKQPEVFYHVADAHVMAIARRDATKLQLEEETAELDVKIRTEAMEADKKLTETAISNLIKIAPVIKDLQQAMLRHQADVNKWLALKEAFRQRNDMLQELSRLHLSRLGGASVSAPRAAMADLNRRTVEAAYETRDRYRPKRED